MLTIEVINKIRRKGRQIRTKAPKRFDALALPCSHKEFTATFPNISVWLRETAGCYNTLTREVIYHFLQCNNPIPVCKICGTLVGFKITKPRVYCSSTCIHKDQALVDKRAATRRAHTPEQKKATRWKVEQTLVRNYGVTNPTKSPIIQKRIRETNIRRYGAPVPTQSKKIRAKLSASLRARSSEEIAAMRAKSVATSQAKYGVDVASQSIQVKEKTKATNLTRYGVSHKRKLPEVRKQISTSMKSRSKDDWEEARLKREATCMARYGVRHLAQDSAFYEASKIQMHKRKQVTLLGETHTVQGYEAYVFKAIEDTMAKIVTNHSKLPDIRYMNPKTNRQSRYYVDGAIRTNKGTKVLVEVKSVYTLANDLKVNLAKIAAAVKWCARKGFVFALAVSDGKSRTRWLYNPTAGEVARCAHGY